jgi:hypothetical protein
VNVKLNTAAQVSSMIPVIPLALVERAIPQAELTGFSHTTNGLTLYGSSLAPANAVVLRGQYRRPHRCWRIGAEQPALLVEPRSPSGAFC